MSKLDTSRRLKELTQEELEILVSAISSTERMLQDRLKVRLEAIEPLANALMSIQAYKQKVISRRVRAP